MEQKNIYWIFEKSIRDINFSFFLSCVEFNSNTENASICHASRKLCGVATPYQGVRGYCGAAIGMPGSESALEELMCKVIGKFIQQGQAAKLADNLYVGGNTPEELYANWEQILHALSECNLKLSPNQTVINPQEVTILGWIWNNGTLKASSHSITSLSTCAIPKTVRQLRSFIGAYKILSRVIKHCSQYLDKYSQ